MPLTIKIGRANQTAIVRLEMDLRKSMNGDLMIFDHGDIDIVLSPNSNKVVAFPKENQSDLVYGAQNRLFTHLRKKGLVISESIQASAFCGAFEATMHQSFKDDLDTAKMTLIYFSKFIEVVRPYFESMEAIVLITDDELVHPDKEDSTELGEVPQSTEQGSIRPGYIRDPYSLNYLYTI